MRRPAQGKDPFSFQRQNKTVTAPAIAVETSPGLRSDRGISAPVLPAPEHDLDPVAAFVGALVVSHGLFA